MLAGAMLAAAPAAQAFHGPVKRLGGGVERITYDIGPIDVPPGQNRIAYRPVTGSQKPPVDGWIVRMKPDLVWANGPRKGHPPQSINVMFHHGVWVNLSRSNSGFGQLFFATGEEKTIMEFPDGYGYRYKASDKWLLNHMLHNLSSKEMKLDIQYTIDFIPDTAPEAASIKPVEPIWMDVERGRIYPVFDVHKGSGENGKFTYPRDDPNAYPPGVHKNLWAAPQDGVLVSAAGHVHSGGLYTDLSLIRPGAKYAGPKCNRKRRAEARRACWDRAPRVKGNHVHLFRSHAKYFEPAGPVSWDMSMKGTRPDWMVQVQKGDTLNIQATYETKLASWYESMGIMVVYWAPGAEYGREPFKTKVDYPGQVTHGHLPENDVHGGRKTDLPDPRKLPSGATTGDPFLISGFQYGAGDYRIPGAGGRPPVVKKGQSLTFELAAPDAAREQWHSLTSCAAPCNGSTGIGYPIPNGKFQFDSGQLGNLNGVGAPPTVGRTTWSTPKNLPVGTYTYFCRIHPSMRGAFRVVN